MSRKLLIGAGLIMAIGIAFIVGQRNYLKRDNPKDEAVFSHPDFNLKVDYCRPSRKGKTIFGEGGVVPYGKIWRTGALESTEITLSQDFLIKGHRLPAGSYSIFTIPDKNGWTVIFNSELNQWTIFDYSSSNDVLRVTLPSTTLDEIVETFIIDFNEENGLVNMELKWENTLVTVPFTLVN